METKSTKLIWVTGFGPFPGAPINPTQKLMGRLPRRLGAHQSGVAFRFDVLPTTWAGRSGVTSSIRDQVNPDAIVHFGVDGTRKDLNVECIAVNKAIRVRPDAVGASPDRPELTANGERRRGATLPHSPLISAAMNSGVPAKVSFDAGTYLCNATLWDSIGSGIPSIFVHVPALPTARTDTRPSYAQIETASVNLLRELARRLR